jgi:hypothetical protein
VPRPVDGSDGADAAHLDYLTNADVGRLIACGLPASALRKQTIDSMGKFLLPQGVIGLYWRHSPVFRCGGRQP